MRRKVLQLNRRDVVWPFARPARYLDQHSRAVSDLAGIATRSDARGVDITAQVREALDGVPVRGEPGVPRVDVREGDSEHAGGARAQHDRHAAARRRQDDRVVDVLELTVECDVLAGEESPHDLERLSETGDGPVE